MSKLDMIQRAYLGEMFGSRVSFDRRERKLYGHDISVLPGLMRPLAGNALPDAVVQPESEAELKALVTWAGENRVPLTPRGKASSGYGGVVPVKGGIIVDFYRMNKIIAIDVPALTARAEAGVIWEKLDGELARHGLTLRLYPSSYPASTVAGWLAQGGAGIGSFEAGWFRANVVAARVVIPGGEVREFTGPDLDLVADAGGVTGLISEVTLRVQPLEDLDVLAIGCTTPCDLQTLAEFLVHENLPVWSMIFINPKMAELKNKAPLPGHGGHATPVPFTLPEVYLVTLAIRKRDMEAVRGALSRILKRGERELLDEGIARHEWDNRFRLMLVKRLGPSLVPSEVVVPLSALGETLAEIEKTIKQPLVKEGIVIREGSGRQTRGGPPRFHSGRPAEIQLQFRFRPRADHYQDRKNAWRQGLFHRYVPRLRGSGGARA